MEGWAGFEPATWRFRVDNRCSLRPASLVRNDVPRSWDACWATRPKPGGGFEPLHSDNQRAPARESRSVLERIDDVCARHHDDDGEQAMCDGDRARLLVGTNDVVELAVDERRLVDVAASHLERIAGLGAELVQPLRHHLAGDQALAGALSVALGLGTAHHATRSMDG